MISRIIFRIPPFSNLPVTSILGKQSPRTMSSITSFHLFPQLSVEIRNMIWICTLKPRYVEIRTHVTLKCGPIDRHIEPSELDTFQAFCFTSPKRPWSALPVALRVHHASRDCILPLYPRRLDGAFVNLETITWFLESLKSLFMHQLLRVHGGLTTLEICKRERQAIALLLAALEGSSPEWKYPTSQEFKTHG